MRTITYTIIILFLMLVYSCRQQSIDIHAFPNNVWNKDDSVAFTFNINDTIETYDLSFFLRNNLNYQYRNLFLLVEVIYDDRVVTADTIEYSITNKYGQWLGRGLGNMKDNYLMFNKSRNFKNSGDYKIIIRHGMRNHQLIGVNKLGFKVK